MRIPPVLPYSAALVGVWLAYTAARNESPLDVLRGVLSGNRETPRALNPAAGDAAGTSPGVTAGATQGDIAAGLGAVTVTGSGAAGMVSIGQGGHKLAPGAAAAFKRWEALFGRQITVTDSYRDPATQAAGYAKDPGRFASPAKSRHPRGEAVDVNLQALGAVPPGATWDRLYSTAVAAGWCNPRGPYKGDHREPWHFSWNGCG